ncbi:hypothetical protein ABE437_15440 [Isoptericola cucumis]|uniref:hypothetical protein n=1 Tax=Isoptericola cucumis TaxID=1776856 RepID=UPI003209391C
MRRPATRPAGVVAGVTSVLLLASLTACQADGGPASGSDASARSAASDTSDDSGRGVRGEPGDDAETTTDPQPADTPAALPTFDPATTVGGYAPDFPKDLLGAPDDATVLASSAVPGDGRLTEVTLNLTTSRSAQQVIDQLAERLRDAGFEESASTTFSGLTAQTTFTRKQQHKKPVLETVLLGVFDEGERRLVTVSGSLVV